MIIVSVIFCRFNLRFIQTRLSTEILKSRLLDYSFQIELWFMEITKIIWIADYNHNLNYTDFYFLLNGH